jgi:hypothetical protein
VKLEELASDPNLQNQEPSIQRQPVSELMKLFCYDADNARRVTMAPSTKPMRVVIALMVEIRNQTGVGAGTGAAAGAGEGATPTAQEQQHRLQTGGQVEPKRICAVILPEGGIGSPAVARALLDEIKRLRVRAALSQKNSAHDPHMLYAQVPRACLFVVVVVFVLWVRVYFNSTCERPSWSQ